MLDKVIHPIVQQKEIPTPIYDLLDNDVFNLVVVSVSGFWAGLLFSTIEAAYYGVV